MDEPTVRQHAQAMADALVAGDVETATADVSEELRRNLGEVIALLPLPATEATVESIEHSGAGYNVILRIVGETDEVQVQTRWKDRDGSPTIVEASHLSRVEVLDGEGGIGRPGEEDGAAEQGTPAQGD
ncbi:MAG: hypothetical protein ABIV26_03395 [Candidatus Limnocylindrales bacterium]